MAGSPQDYQPIQSHEDEPVPDGEGGWQVQQATLQPIVTPLDIHSQSGMVSSFYGDLSGDCAEYKTFYPDMMKDLDEPANTTLKYIAKGARWIDPHEYVEVEKDPFVIKDAVAVFHTTSFYICRNLDLVLSWRYYKLLQQWVGKHLWPTLLQLSCRVNLQSEVNHCMPNPPSTLKFLVLRRIA